jgi:CBS domain-containing protein
MVTAKDIMTTDIITVKKDIPVYEAIEQMLENQVAGIPVVADDMSLLGIITEKDILKLYKVPAEGLVKTVEDFMTSPAVQFEQDENLQELCLCLIENDFRRVPVTADGKVIGVISRPDVARHILELSRQSAAGH